MFLSDFSSLEIVHTGWNSEALRGHATYSGGDLCFSTLSSPKTIPSTGGKPNAKLIKGNKINKGLDGGMASWHHTEGDKNRS